jgi:hypothetical protein
VEFRVSNPHSMVYVHVPDETGAPRLWAVEWVSALQLKRQGITIQTLKVGDRLVVSGFPAMNVHDHRLWLRTVKRPADGWKWTGTFH